MTDIGDELRFGNAMEATAAAPFEDIDGNPSDPSAVVLTILKPDGTTLVYGWPSAGADGTLQHADPGRFYADVVIDQSGHWRYRLEGTGAVTAAAEGSVGVQRRRVP